MTAVVKRPSSRLVQPAEERTEAGLDQAIRAGILPPVRIRLEGGLDLAPRSCQFQREGRINRPRFGGTFELVDDCFRLLHVEHRERRPAVAAGRFLRQVDRRAAVRTAERLNVALQLLDLARREGADEVLLAEEVEERDQPPVTVAAP